MGHERDWLGYPRRAWQSVPASWRASPPGRLLRDAYHWARKLRNHPAFPGNAGRIVIPHLEIHITHKCNLTCEGCLHFTNHRHTGTLTLDELKRSMGLWSRRLLPMRFAILGGEPCLHRELVEIVRLAREMWPDPRTEMELVTNGLLLHLHPELPQALVAARMRLSISIHSDATISPRYETKLARNLALAHEWQRNCGIELNIDDSLNEWTRGYHGMGSRILPFEDGDAQQSWDNCVTGQQCFQLFEDRLWKCAPLAYLRLQTRKFELSEKWNPYLRYRPLDPGCSDQEIVDFFAKGAESVCAMCPASPQKFIKKNPLLPLRFYASAPEEPPHRRADPQDLGVVQAQ